MSKQANKRVYGNNKEKLVKNSRKKWARILTLSTSSILFICLLIVTIINGSTDFRVAALMLNGLVMIFAIVAIYMPLASGIALLILDFIWLATIDKSWASFRDYGTLERIVTILLTLLLFTLIVGTVMHIYDGWQNRKKS